MTISLELMAAVRGTLSQDGDGGVAALAVNEVLRRALTNGTAANQANGLYIDKFNIAASGSLDIDLAGSLTDRLGSPLLFTAVKAILVIADATNVNNVVYGNGTNPFVGPLSAGTATLTVKPGSFIYMTDFTAAGWPVTAGSADVIRLANSAAGSAVTGTIVVVGEV